jgi:transposase InsO family protein
LETVIEVLSRYAFAVPVWRENTESMTKAVENVLAQFRERFGRYLKTAQFDDGKKFYNVGVKTLLKDHDVHYFSTRTFRKAALVERFNRTLKQGCGNISRKIGRKFGWTLYLTLSDPIITPHTGQ